MLHHFILSPPPPFFLPLPLLLIISCVCQRFQSTYFFWITYKKQTFWYRIQGTGKSIDRYSWARTVIAHIFLCLGQKKLIGSLFSLIKYATSVQQCLHLPSTSTHTNHYSTQLDMKNWWITHLLSLKKKPIRRCDSWLQVCILCKNILFLDYEPMLVQFSSAMCPSCVYRNKPALGQGQIFQLVWSKAN